MLCKMPQLLRQELWSRNCPRNPIWSRNDKILICHCAQLQAGAAREKGALDKVEVNSEGAAAGDRL